MLLPPNSMIQFKILLQTILVAAALVLSIRPARAQQFSLGILGGGSATSGFPNQTFASTIPGLQYGLPLTVFTTTSSGGGDYLVGGMVEARLPKHLSIEADGIYRPLNFRSSSSSIPPGSGSAPSNTVLTWEFPVLLKGRFVRIPVLPSAGAYRGSHCTCGSSRRRGGRRRPEQGRRRIRILASGGYASWSRRSGS